MENRENDILISVIIPVYNTDHAYLSECLYSLSDQDFDSFEVIMVNDGSKNGCEKILSEFAERDSRFIFEDRENGGTSVARNRGLSLARGEYVLFVDSDDYVAPETLKKVYKAMDKERTDILFFGYYTKYTNQEIRRVLDRPEKMSWEREALELAVLQGDKRLGAVEIGTPWGKLIKRSVISENKLGYTPGLIKGQDTVFILSLIDHCESFAYYPYPGYYYRASASSVTHRFNPRIVGIMEKTLEAYGDFIESRGKGTAFKAAVRNKYLNVLLGEYPELYFLHPDNKDPYKKRSEEYKALLQRSPYYDIIDASDGCMGGFIRRMELRFLKDRNIRALFAVKKAEMLLKRILIHNFG